jgi:AcrR family transcriptional regulator
MKKGIEGLLKQEILNTTLALIDKKGGASGVNLREVARALGCSAPNIYNYFSSHYDLMNSVLIMICEDYKKYLSIKTAYADNPESLLLSAFSTYIEYAIAYPGRLNFYHFEKLDITISEEAFNTGISVGDAMAALLDKGSESKISNKKTEEVCKIIHCYLLGELSEYITGRIKLADKENYAKSLVLYCRKLFDTLIQNI